MVSFKRSLSIEILDVVVNDQKKYKTESEPQECIILGDDFDEKVDEIEENLDETHFHMIASIISDCDPDFIREKLATYSTTVANRVETIVNEILDATSYPKIIDSLKKKRKQEHALSALNKEYSIDDLCKTYSDPIAIFNDQNRKRSDSYKISSLIFLRNKFQHLSPKSIENVLVNVNYALTPACHSLTEVFLPRENVLKKRCGIKSSINFQHKRKHYKYLNKPNDVQSYPENLDEDFLRELWFLKNESSVTKEFVNKKFERQLKLIKAKEENSLFECQCCFDDQLLFEDMVACEKAHLFCRNCIRKYAETNIGDMKYEFPCFSVECDSKFSQETLEMVLEKNVFDKLCKKLCTKAIQEANLENLESCPFCEYVAIIESPDEKIFYCMNPECMKDSCRKCKEPNHLPMKCEEVENKTEVDMRTWIENKMNEAMIRVCYKCNKRFYKEEGCNMMHCQCGAKMCYICRQPITSYGHFGSGNKCSQFNDTNEVHMNEMKEAYEKACKEYYEKYPQKIGLQLKFDPKIFLEKVETDKKAKKNNLIPNANHYLARLNQDRQVLRENYWFNLVQQQNVQENQPFENLNQMVQNMRREYQDFRHLNFQVFPQPLALNAPVIPNNQQIPFNFGANLINREPQTNFNTLNNANSINSNFRI